LSSIFQLEKPSKFKSSPAARLDEDYCQYRTMHILKGKAALLVIDVQHDFIDDGAPVHCVGGKDMLSKIK